MTTWQEVAPDGIEERNQQPIADWRRHASPLSLVVFGAVVAMGLSGLLGHERDWTASGGGVDLRVHAPEVIRNGEFLELRVTVESSDPLAAPAIGVDAALWEDMTVNTMIPAATTETSANGVMRFEFEPIEAGALFLWKVDMQVNPDTVGGNAGAVTIYDGDDLLVSVDVSTDVLP